VLLGFCFGGILAYEVAQQLSAAGEEVSLLVMIDSTLDSGMPTHRRRVGGRLRQTYRRECDRLPIAVQRRLLGEEWVSQAKQLDRARMRIYLRAMRKYDVKPYGGPAVLVKPEKPGAIHESAWGWGTYVDDLAVCEVTGSHQTHLQRGNAHLVAQALRPHIDRAARAERPA
jgi:thioesterase domain-containing protein